MDSPDTTPNRYRRKLMLLAVLVACLAAWFVFEFSPRTATVDDGPAGPAVSSVSFQRAWTDRSVLLVGMGDSVTAGFGATRGHSYFERLIANPSDEFPEMKDICLRRVLPNLRALSLAKSGTTSLQHEAEQISLLKLQAPDVLGIIVFTTGGNDLIHDYGRSPPKEGAMYGATMEQGKPWVAAFEARLQRMLDRVEGCFPGGCEVFLANIYDPTDAVGDMQRGGLPKWPDGLKLLAMYNQVIATQANARDHVHLVDIHGPFLGHGLHSAERWREHYQAADPHYWYHQNLEDPNDRGYDAIRRLFLNRMAEVFRERPLPASKPAD